MASTGERWAAGGDLRVAATRLCVVGAWVAGLCIVGLAAYQYVLTDGFGMDTHAYWLSGHETPLYGLRPGANDAYLYSPLFAQIIHPLTLLPWPTFRLLWIVAEAFAYLWLLWPLPLRWRALAYLWCLPALFIGNIFGALGVALVFALRKHPGFWAYPLLTKVTPAGVGVLWHLVRGEFDKLAHVAVATALLVSASVAVSPHLWVEWLAFLSHHSGDQAWRLAQTVVSVGLAVYAARTDRKWLLVVAFWLTMAPPWFCQAWGALAPLVRLSSASWSQESANFAMFHQSPVVTVQRTRQ